MDHTLRHQQFLKNRYCIDGVLGEGGTGKVYSAVDQQTQQRVAIKKIKSAKLHNPEYTQRLYREYKFLSMIRHPNVVMAHDLFQDDDSLFLVMELVEGISLSGFLESPTTSLSLLDKCAIAIQISRAVEVINTAGILHRDIKPQNIILNESTYTVKLLDLGVGHNIGETKKAAGVISGTLEYMSPEQAEEKVSSNSDVFSLAVVLYQFFLENKHSPFYGNNTYEVLYNVSSENPRSLYECAIEKFPNLTRDERGIYKSLSLCIQKSLEKNPEKRLSCAKLLTEQLVLCHQVLLEKNQKITDTIKWRPGDQLSQLETNKLKRIGDIYGRDIAQAIQQGGFARDIQSTEEIKNYLKDPHANDSTLSLWSMSGERTPKYLWLYLAFLLLAISFALFMLFELI